MNYARTLTKQMFLTILVLSFLAQPFLSANTSAAEPRRFRIVSYNALIDLPTKTVLADVRQIIRDTSAEVITLQENYSDTRRAAIMRTFACNTCRYDGFTVDGIGREENMILWDKSRFSLLDSGALKTTTRIVENGKSLGPLHLNFVRLQMLGTKADKQIIVGSNHLPSLVDRDDDGKPNVKLLPQRVKLYETHSLAVNEKVNAWKASHPNTPIFITGDYNVNYRKDSVVQHRIFPYATFKKVDGSSNWELTSFPKTFPNATTHRPLGPVNQPKNRLIDYVFSIPNGTDLSIHSTRVLSTGLDSDHNAVLASYSFRLPQ